MRILALMMVGLCFVGCNEKRHQVEFCGIESGQFDKQSMVIDLEHRRVLGSDTSFGFKIVSTPFAKGFVEPFPFVLPTVPLEEVPSHWEVGGYEFTVGPVGKNDTSWVLISADARGHAETRRHSSVLYSSKRGVIAIQLSGPVINEVFNCGTGQIRGTSFATPRDK